MRAIEKITNRKNDQQKIKKAESSIDTSNKQLQPIDPHEWLLENNELYRAIIYGQDKAVKRLLDQGEDPNIFPTVNGIQASTTPLILATRIESEDSKEIIEHLLNAGANINGTDQYGYTALHATIQQGRTEIAELILSNPNVDVNIQNDAGHTALHNAVLWNNDKIAELILSNPNINVNIRNDAGSTALHKAIQQGHTEIAELILSNQNIDVNIRNDMGNTALHEAIQQGHTEIAELILSNPNIDVNIRNDAGKTPLDYLISPNGQIPRDKIDLYQKLMAVQEKQTKSTKTSTSGMSALHNAGENITTPEIKKQSSVQRRPTVPNRGK